MTGKSNTARRIYAFYTGRVCGAMCARLTTGPCSVWRGVNMGPPVGGASNARAPTDANIRVVRSRAVSICLAVSGKSIAAPQASGIESTHSMTREKVIESLVRTACTRVPSATTTRRESGSHARHSKSQRAPSHSAPITRLDSGAARPPCGDARPAHRGVRCHVRDPGAYTRRQASKTGAARPTDGPSARETARFSKIEPRDAQKILQLFYDSL